MYEAERSFYTKKLKRIGYMLIGYFENSFGTACFEICRFFNSLSSCYYFVLCVR